MTWHFEEVWRYREAIWNGLLMTLQLNVIVLVTGTLVGCFIAALRLSPVKTLRWVGRVYVDLFRAFPLLVLLVWLFFALPLLPGITLRLEPFYAAVIGLSINLGAFVAEIVRAGVNAVAADHVHAARVAGFTKWQTWRHITAPIALRLMLAPLFGQYLNQVKLSVLASIIAVPELLHTVNTITTVTFRPLELYTILAVIFLAILLPSTWLQGHLEAKLSGNTRTSEDFSPMPHLSESHDSSEKAAVTTIPDLTTWPTHSEDTSLVVSQLSASYNGTPILRNISLDLKKGIVTAVIGANGCGKTTLLRCLCGILSMDTGTIQVKSTTKLDQVQFGYLSQEHEPWPHLTVKQNLILPLQIVKGVSKQEAKATARKWLEVMQLEDRADSRPTELSGGQRQRLTLARTLCLRPHVLLLDEPTSAMDFRWVVAIRNMLKELANAGVLIVAVSHGIGFLRSTADQLVFLDRGRVEELGSASRLLHKPRSTELRAFLEAV